ncbi:MAG: SLBB domain-containing protein [Melioribacteraceae bacterium]|nr:SLBB domain-containing protein [Melioribacteraceae bacterium]
MKKIIIIYLILLVQLIAQEEQSNTKQNPLLSLQTITVTIGGDFILTGSFTAYKSQRLDHFITTIYTQAQQRALQSLNTIETISQVKKNLERYPLRNITLKHSDGSVQKIDLLKFRLLGDFIHNPYLQNDDVIIFPINDDERNFVEVLGAVNKPLKFQFVDGDKLSDAILFAGGLNKAYDNIEKAEISRLDKSGEKENKIIVNIKDDFELQRGDRIRILSDESHKLSFKVLVIGEVKFPGYVYVKRSGSTLKEIIESVGGVKENADLSRAEVIRDFNSVEMLRKLNLEEMYINKDQNVSQEYKIKMEQLKESLKLARMNNLLEEDTLFFNIDNQLRVLKAESLVDFSKINDPDSEAGNFLVKDGDLILIPDKFDYVYVFGQVSKAGYVKYSQGKDYKYYIDKAGGKGEVARDDEEIVIVKGKEMKWITKEKDKIEIEPGDYIYVPKEIPRSFWYHFSKVTAVISVVGSVATLVLLLKQFTK